MKTYLHFIIPSFNDPSIILASLEYENPGVAVFGSSLGLHTGHPV